MKFRVRFVLLLVFLFVAAFVVGEVAWAQNEDLPDSAVLEVMRSFDQKLIDRDYIAHSGIKSVAQRAFAFRNLQALEDFDRKFTIDGYIAHGTVEMPVASTVTDPCWDEKFLTPGHIVCPEPDHDQG